MMSFLIFAYKKQLGQISSNVSQLTHCIYKLMGHIVWAKQYSARVIGASIAGTKNVRCNQIAGVTLSAAIGMCYVCVLRERATRACYCAATYRATYNPRIVYPTYTHIARCHKFSTKATSPKLYVLHALRI